MAAPFAGWFSRVLPQKALMALVAVIVGGLGVYNFVGLVLHLRLRPLGQPTGQSNKWERLSGHLSALNLHIGGRIEQVSK